MGTINGGGKKGGGAFFELQKTSTFTRQDGMFVTLDEKNQLTSLQVIKDATNAVAGHLHAYNDGTFGHPSPSEFWGFKAGVIALQLELLKACADELVNTVPDTRPVWSTKIQELAGLLGTLSGKANSLCDAVQDGSPTPTKAV